MQVPNSSLWIGVIISAAIAFGPASTSYAIDEGPSYLKRTFSSFGDQEVQFMLFLVSADDADSDVNRIVKERMGSTRTHEANRSYWASLSQNNDKQLVMAWYDRTHRKFQWVRIRWHRETTRVLQVTNDSMTRWTNLDFGESRRFSYSVGENRYVLEIRNPPVDGGWDKNDVIYSFKVYDR